MHVRANPQALARLQNSAYWKHIRNKPRESDITRQVLQPLRKAYTKNDREKLYRDALIMDWLVKAAVSPDDAAKVIVELGGMSKAFAKARDALKPSQTDARKAREIPGDDAIDEDADSDASDDMDDDDESERRAQHNPRRGERRSHPGETGRYRTTGVLKFSTILEAQVSNEELTEILTAEIVRLVVNVQPSSGFKPVVLHSFDTVRPRR